jgi:serine/threonine-protein kinase
VRRTPQNTGFTPDPAPFPHQVRWVYRTSKPLHASPAVVDNYVYFTTEDGRVVALDRLTGQQVWAYSTGWLSASTPAVTDAWVIVTIRPGRVIALDRHTGAWRWEVDLGQPIMALTSPIIGDGSVYIGAADGKLHALDVATGHRRWAFASKDWILSTAAYAGKRVIVASQDTRIYAIGTRSGRQRFVYPTGRGQHAGAGMAIAGSLAYFGSSGGRVSAMAWKSTTYPFDLLVQRWKGRLFLWGIMKQVPEQKGRVWSTRVGGDVVHIPAVAHQSVYVSTYQGDVMGLDAATGVIRWATGVQTRATSAPTVAGREVLVGAEDGVVGLDVHSGALQWRFKTPGRVTGSPIVAGDTMYVASHDGVLYAVTASQ